MGEGNIDDDNNNDDITQSSSKCGEGFYETYRKDYQMMEDRFGSVGEITHRASLQRQYFSVVYLILVVIVLGGYAIFGLGCRY